MGKRDMSGVNGPSWSDIRMMMMEVGAAGDVRIDIHCSGAAGVNRSESLVWTVRAYRWGNWGEHAPLAFESGLWPQAMYATVPGMLYGLLCKLDAKLELLNAAKQARRLKGLFDKD